MGDFGSRTRPRKLDLRVRDSGGRNGVFAADVVRPYFTRQLNGLLIVVHHHKTITTDHVIAIGQNGDDFSGNFTGHIRRPTGGSLSLIIALSPHPYLVLGGNIVVSAEKTNAGANANIGVLLVVTGHALGSAVLLLDDHRDHVPHAAGPFFGVNRIAAPLNGIEGIGENRRATNETNPKIKYRSHVRALHNFPASIKTVFSSRTFAFKSLWESVFSTRITSPI